MKRLTHFSTPLPHVDVEELGEVVCRAYLWQQEHHPSPFSVPFQDLYELPSITVKVVVEVWLHHALGNSILVSPRIRTWFAPLT